MLLLIVWMRKEEVAAQQWPVGHSNYEAGMRHERHSIILCEYLMF